jgi:hypothetical protein
MAAESPVGGGGNNSVTTRDVVVEADRAKEEAKLESQQTTIITREDIVKKQAKSVEDVIFSETGVSRTVDAMGRVGVSIRGAEPRHTLILVDGQAVMGDFAKYYGAGDELLRQGTENVERIEIIQGAASAKYGSDAIGGVINIITRKPAQTAGMEVNAEGRRVKDNSDVFPYQNIFLRADSGQMGKVRATIFGSKRDVLPIYDNSGMTLLPPSIMTTDLGNYKNSLRYYGTISNVGLAAEYDVNDHNTISFNANHYKEDLKKDTKHTNTIFEPYQKFKRTADRNTYGLSWKGKLGYAWLHAVNKSDPDMPRQLLDKPQHKVDIGISYDNVKSGWSGALWGDYYINMLDSNSVAGNGNYMTSVSDPNDDTKSVIKYNFAEGGKQTYQKKTFGIWNVMVQKKLDKDSLVYFGVDNIFNHRDYDRALQERVYKMGFNMKFGYDGHKKEESKKAVVTSAVAEGQGTGVAGKDGKEVVRANEKSVVGTAATEKNRQRDAFITAPFDVDKKPGVELIGDYQARWNVHGGSDKPVATVTATTHVGDAAKNMLDQKEHGFEQRLCLGFDARIGDNTNVTVLGSASGMSGVDTKHDVSDSRGLNHQRLENMDVTQHANKWDFSIGRLTEAMGVTGYWFGKEYDGGRAVWTSGKNQIRLGYGDFSSSTGVNDSAYTHAIRQTFYRAPTAGEFLGTNFGMASLPAELRVLAPVEGAGNTI